MRFCLLLQDLYSFGYNSKFITRDLNDGDLALLQGLGYAKDFLVWGYSAPTDCTWEIGKSSRKSCIQGEWDRPEHLLGSEKGIIGTVTTDDSPDIYPAWKLPWVKDPSLK